MNDNRQRSAGRGRGQAPRQQQAQRGQQGNAPTANEQISIDQRAQQRMALLFELIRDRRDQIEAVLPLDIPYAKFEAAVQMAIRREPRLLDCYLPSLIKACVQSAYDELLPDGNQAVILISSNKVPGSGERGENAVYRSEARYQSMVYGLRLKLVRAGAVKFIDGIVVHRNDQFDFELGANRRLEHKPTPLDKEPGDPIGAYAVAILPDGTKVFDVLRMPEIMKAKDVAKTKSVWEGPFGLEMWKKTAIRRLSKAVPTTTTIRDAEAMEMFPQFSGNTLGQAALPAPTRPDRRAFTPALEDRQELPIDLGAFEGGYEDRGAQYTEVDERDQGGEQRQDEQKKAAPDPAAKKKPAAAAKDDGDREAQAIPLPETDEQWSTWASNTVAGIRMLSDGDAVNERWEAMRGTLEKAPKEIRESVNDEIRDHLTDLTTGDGPAASQQGSLLPADGDEN